MDTTTLIKITDKVKLLPDSMAEEVLLYIELLLKKSNVDWFDSLSENEKESIQQGLDDIKYGRIQSHDSVMEEMSTYLRGLNSY